MASEPYATRREGGGPEPRQEPAGVGASWRVVSVHVEPGWSGPRGASGAES